MEPDLRISIKDQETFFLPITFPLRLVLENPAVVFFLLQLPASFLVHNHRAARVKLQRRGRDHARDRAFDGLGDDVRLAVAGRQQDAAARFDDCAHAHRDAAARHLVFAAERGRVLLHGRGRERLHARARAKRGKRFVETDVPRLADAEELQINSARARNRGFVAATFLVEVGREAVGPMPVARVNVHVPEKMFLQVMTAGVRIGWRQADVFVEVERAAGREIKFLLAMHPHEMAINAFHRLARREA